jgi:hypothetical protein
MQMVSVLRTIALSVLFTSLRIAVHAATPCFDQLNDDQFLPKNAPVSQKWSATRDGEEIVWSFGVIKSPSGEYRYTLGVTHNFVKPTRADVPFVIEATLPGGATFKARQMGAGNANCDLNSDKCSGTVVAGFLFPASVNGDIEDLSNRDQDLNVRIGFAHRGPFVVEIPSCVIDALQRKLSR